MATTNIYGIRAILEALDSDKQLAKVYLLKDGDGVLLNQLKSAVQQHNLSSSFVPVEKLDHMAKGGNHQGAVATISPVDFTSLEDVLELHHGEESDTALKSYLLLDGITDVRNFGAIIRTAECTGVDAIIISEKGSAPINAATVKTSAGAVFNMPICKVNHIKDAVYLLQAYGIQIIGANEKATNLIYNTDLNKNVAIVMGDEGRGINPSTLKVLDDQFKLPIKGEIESLNVSVACGAILYEMIRQRLK